MDRRGFVALATALSPFAGLNLQAWLEKNPEADPKDWDGWISHLIPIMPHNSLDLEKVARGLYVGKGGSVKLTSASGDTMVLHCPSGTILPIFTRRVWCTDTTASEIVGLL